MARKRKKLSPRPRRSGMTPERRARGNRLIIRQTLFGLCALVVSWVLVRSGCGHALLCWLVFTFCFEGCRDCLWHRRGGKLPPPEKPPERPRKKLDFAGIACILQAVILFFPFFYWRFLIAPLKWAYRYLQACYHRNRQETGAENGLPAVENGLQQGNEKAA